MTEKLDIFETLKQIDKKNINYFDNLDMEAKKSLAPVVFMRWFSSGNTKQLQLANAILNPMVYKMYHHPALMYKLFVACSDGKSKRYNWIKKKSKDKSAPTATATIAAYQKCSKTDAARYRSQFTMDEIIEMAEDMGYDNEWVKKIKTELK